MRKDLQEGGKLASVSIKNVEGGKNEFMPPTKLIEDINCKHIADPIEIQSSVVEDLEKVYWEKRNKPDRNKVLQSFRCNAVLLSFRRNAVLSSFR